MANFSLNPAITTAIEAVLANTAVTQFTADVQITNLQDMTYSYSPLWLESFTIESHYADNFADSITIEFTAEPDAYIQLFNNSKDLQVSIRFVYINPQTGQRVFTPPPISKVYKAMLQDPQDLLKKHTTGSLKPTPFMPLTEQHVAMRIPVKMSLIESKVYTIKQQKFNVIYSNATVNSAISHIIAGFGITQAYVVAPDNKLNCSHIIIPPNTGISEIFDYLQINYGVYMKGLDWYYTGDILYHYPAYENNPSIKYVADVYNAPSGGYTGLLSYHSTSGSNQISIVSTSSVDTKDLSNTSAENVGNAFSVTRASTIIDRFVTTTAKGTFINNNNAITVNSPTDRTISKSSNNPQHMGTTDNIFYASSKLAKWNAALIQCGWINAVPYQLYPGHNIKYHFDQDGKFQTQQGLLERVSYTFKRVTNPNGIACYRGNAMLYIRADSDVTNTPQTTAY